MKKLLWRCDDFGTATGANEGILRLARLGLPISVSVLVCAADARVGLEELAGLGSHVCLGVHAAINSEWADLKWGAAGKAGKASRLVDGNGYFHPDYEIALREKPEVIAAEIEAQIGLAQSWNIPFSYLDEHMGFAWLEGVAPLLTTLAAKHGLIYARDLPGLPEVKDASSDLLERLAQQLAAAPSEGPFLAVFHPVVDDVSTKKYYFKRGEEGLASAERQRELNVLSSDGWRDLVSAEDVKLVTYRDL